MDYKKTIVFTACYQEAQCGWLTFGREGRLNLNLMRYVNEPLMMSKGEALKLAAALLNAANLMNGIE